MRRPGKASQQTDATEPLWRELVGDCLRDLRLDAGLRLTDVAGRAGISPQYLSEVERGRKDPSSEMLAAVAGSLDLTVAEVASLAVGRAGAPAVTCGDAFCLAA